MQVAESNETLVQTIQELQNYLNLRDYQSLSLWFHELLPSTDEHRSILSSQDGFLQFITIVLQTLEKETSQDATLLGTDAAKLVAELAKEENSRNLIGEGDIISTLLNLLQQMHDQNHDEITQEFVIQILRCFGNLCFDHDGNRDVIGETEGGVVAILKCLNSSNITLMTTCCAVLLNLTMENDVIQKTIVENAGLDMLLNLLNAATSDTASTAILKNSATLLRILGNVLETETGSPQFQLSNGLGCILKVITFHLSRIKNFNETQVRLQSLDVLEAAGSTLEMVIEEDATQRDVISDGLLITFFDIVDTLYAQLLGKSAQESMEDLEEEGNELDIIRSLIKMYCQLVTLVTLNDYCMPELVGNPIIINTFKNWIQLEPQDGLEDAEIRCAGALCLGNLARSDITCFRLVDSHGVGSLLITLLKSEVDKLQKNDTNASIKLIQAITSALKNLCLSGSCRSILGSLDLFEVIVSLSECWNVKPVHFTCIGIIKNLVSGETDENAYRFILATEPPENVKLADVPLLIRTDSRKTYLERLNRVIWNSTGENDTGIRNEGGRIIANLIKTCHRTNAPQLAEALVESGSITLLIQIISGTLLTVEDTDTLDDQYAHYNAPVGLDQVFPIVQNEGLVALTLLCSLCPTALPRIVEFHKHLIHSFKLLLKSTEGAGAAFGGPHKDEDMSAISKLNVCQLLLVLCKGSEKMKKLAYSDLQLQIAALNKKSKGLDHSQESVTSKQALRGSSLLLPFPKDAANLRQNGRRLSFSDTLKYRKELEVNVQQEGGLEKALSIQGSASLMQVTDGILKIFDR